MSVKALGWDVHRKFSQVSVQRRDDDGEIRVIERKRLEHFDREAIAWGCAKPNGFTYARPNGCRSARSSAPRRETRRF